MPRVDTTPMRHAKHDAQQRVSLIRRTSATAVSSTTESLSAPVTLEPAPTAIPSAPPTSEPWRHPDELAFINIRGETWDDMTIIRFLRANILSIPPRPTSTVEPWVLIGCADGTEVTLPRMYRVPLLWVLKFLWMSVALVLRENEWEDRKFDLLHIARLVATLIAGARTAIDNGTIERGWRCAAFDRALRRYWHRWLLTRDEFVRAFWYEFNEEEYEGDVLKLGWGQWVLKGHKGFLLTKEEVAQGISAAEFMHGFVVDEERGTFKWVDNSLESPSKMDAQLSVPVERKRLVPVEEQTPIPEPAIQTKLLPPPPPPSEPQTQTTPKRKFSAPISTPPPPKKVSFSHVEVPALKRRKTGNAPVCGSVTLAELVSRIPIAGRHRSYGSGTPLETSASRIRRAWQVEEFHMPVDLTPQNTETTPTTHKSPKPTASPVDVEHKAVDTIPVRLEPDERRCSPVETTVASPNMEMQENPPEAQPALVGVSEPQQPEVHITPGCLPFRGHPTDVFTQPLHGRAGWAGSEVEEGKQQEEGRPNSVGASEPDGKEAGVPVRDDKNNGEQNQIESESGIEERTAEAGEDDGDKMEGVETQILLEDDLDLGEDLQLLYPESSPVTTCALGLESRASHRASPSPSHSGSHSSSSSSSSRSASPLLPALSSAHFSSSTTAPPVSALFMQASTATLALTSTSRPVPPSASDELASTTPSYHLTVPSSGSTALQLSPRRALVELAAEPNLFARLTQSWGELRAEVNALRAEMRTAPGAVAQLEARVGQLEQGASPKFSVPSPSPSQPSLQSNSAQRWHPLQHLIEDTEMDVDPPSPPVTGVNSGRAMRYAASEEGEPLPPRSRKFSSTSRLVVG